MRYEITVSTQDFEGKIEEKDVYTNDLIVALARFGYSPYFTEEGDVCFSVYSKLDVNKLDEEAIEREVDKYIM